MMSVGGSGGDETLSSLPRSDSYGSSASASPTAGRLLPPAVQELRISEHDKELLRQCQEESIKRAAPCAAIAGGLTHFAVGIGKLAPHPRYGSLFKVLGSTLAGFMFGKISYLRECEAKFKADPLSAIGQAIREREGGFVTDPSAVPTSPPVTPPGYSMTPPPMQPNDTEEAPPSRAFNSYEELRLRNRLNAAGSGNIQKAPPSPNAGVRPEMRPMPGNDDYGSSNDDYERSNEPSPDPPSLRRRRRINAYGDELEDV